LGRLVLTPLPGRDIGRGAPCAAQRLRLLQTHGRLEQSVKCLLIWLAVSRTPQC